MSPLGHIQFIGNGGHILVTPPGSRRGSILFSSPFNQLYSPLKFQEQDHVPVLQLTPMKQSRAINPDDWIQSPIEAIPVSFDDSPKPAPVKKLRHTINDDSTFTCHRCSRKHGISVPHIRCCQQQKLKSSTRQCKLRFCITCVKIVDGVEPTPGDWSCPRCRGECKCYNCTKANSKKRARESGTDSE